MDKKTILIILDGWGYGNKSDSDVIFKGDTPYFDSLVAKYPNSQLAASGENVGLPDGQMGNSEVGHLNIGAGRVVYQDLVKINLAIRDNSISQNPELVKALNYAKENGKQVHFLGLVSKGGVHSSQEHLYKLTDVATEFGLDKIFVHAFMDGRDTDPKSGKGYVTELLEHMKNNNGEVASVIGRYYAMDRDKRWERVKEAYDLLVKGVGTPVTDVVSAIQESYNNNVTDEFIKPIVKVDANGNPVGNIQEGDVIIFFNFRNDRAREITEVLTQRDMPEYDMKTLPLYYCTMTPYDATYKGMHVLFDKDNVTNTIGEIVAANGLAQLRMAETEKYAHVTFFFSGGREEVFANEERILVNSPKVPTYDHQPEMSAYEVRDEVVAALNKKKFDFICLNYANGDMVGHTGDYNAILKAVKAVDECLRDTVEAAKANGYEAIIIADHGNADNAVNEDGSPNTAHSLNPVPFIWVTDRKGSVTDGILADVAPSILKIMGVEKPAEMTGKSLITIE
ncbi:2,3-bisphosphoglycerate-independent phosphoglycerate mutase [Alkalitalea saponilacus]|uniref:2,3-bisphosphoglycerate-independent phosphoglycerate mutase n=1 Tax=Alkalitalea saponilacus TaxID=889453 RepID=A0A1T5BHP7_9BACT|nr:2,3-bisphosphoglycerate-independent phosphoglycerate mutase [Alkalitalea saponilacus]ASB49683.1 phosphoglycerate mutase (2,3-diphosphoglycerate-independent) [Alkalitalea saponilacus]SKB46766.1 phosphoglycerate mutase [Alkalitalea saponilacus]